MADLIHDPQHVEVVVIDPPHSLLVASRFFDEKLDLSFIVAGCTPGEWYTGWLWVRVYNSGAHNEGKGTDELSRHRKFRCEGSSDYGPGL